MKHTCEHRYRKFGFSVPSKDKFGSLANLEKHRCDLCGGIVSVRTEPVPKQKEVERATAI